MPDTATFYGKNASFPAIVRFQGLPPTNALLVVNAASDAIYIEVPSIDVTINPTKELFGRLNELKTIYSKAWLPGSVEPSARAFQDAKDFIVTLPLAKMAKPEIHIASDGEVNFQWTGADFQIDLGFYGNQKFSFYGEKKGQQPIIGDDAAVKDGIPSALVNFAVID